MSIKPVHVIQGVVAAVVYTGVCIGAGEEITDDINEYLEHHEIETKFDKVKAVGYYTYRYGLTVTKALLSTAAIALIFEGTAQQFIPTKQ